LQVTLPLISSGCQYANVVRLKTKIKNRFLKKTRYNIQNKMGSRQSKILNILAGQMTNNNWENFFGLGPSFATAKPELEERNDGATYSFYLPAIVQGSFDESRVGWCEKY
jgi:hypothetical protein